MTKTPLKEYLEGEDTTQKILAESVGLTQGAIGKMLRTKREIFVIEGPDGEVELYEGKTIAGSRQTDSSKAA